jgi:hypothetical protein
MANTLLPKYRRKMMAKKRVFVGMLVFVLGMFVSCAIVPRAKIGEIVEGTITEVRDTSRETYNLNYDPDAARFWGNFYTESMWIPGEKGKLYYVQTHGRNLSRGLQQHFFLNDFYAGLENLKVGDLVKYRVDFVENVGGLAQVAITPLFLED